ncbi:hypothetical protein A2130_04135 [Candidatus Woesebacteria bacterium GWC2_33_12]|uniref:Uncharacterized protein n=1 Tax=Candidatus Woesebacteria bacterium GW2011_GWB1_33_22 TaxID=1618566 RepID=A0A0G0C319_9BACT|nr:MAG: hypothetical protein UR29_C0001G0150 [Candidatus Woesebacteria bacterium GW2011_GWC2_33_12]KKP42640.1 MAG: hypothetical protein UR33_C0001G0001 [Candidatus Woesebacteria bacterium GW2011_GWA2_33_20]KKP45585.1 MAG: hypothetical protein UR35_C0001G0182 [Candidatus Woesebacteria bacterium GW2011_GWB1_33_22]KKP47457.1 MAG: hypothetical protein UR37_C0001G0150 [Microgenomates group bacterium GW2011_GWC1_33_28]KKP51203.1 MAG: hypothetical protein UR41_C0001G0150 [Candidatus Woesebacteria bact
MPQQFGNFVYPDFFTFDSGSAYCRDCGAIALEKPLTGSLKLNTMSSNYSLPAVEGNLIDLCGDHHFELGHSGGAKHNVFRIEVNGRTIGETNPISSMATGSVVVNLIDENLRRQFELKQSELNAAFGRFWRI